MRGVDLASDHINLRKLDRSQSDTGFPKPLHTLDLLFDFTGHLAATPPSSAIIYGDS